MEMDEYYMKRFAALSITICISIMLTGVFIISTSSCNLKEPERITVDLTDVESFNLSYYKRQVDDPTVNLVLKPDLMEEENVGVVDNAQVAEEKARYIWAKYYVEHANENDPAKVSYDEKEDLWHVATYFPLINTEEGITIATLGSTPHIIFKSNGDILAVFHDGMGGGW